MSEKRNPKGFATTRRTILTGATAFGGVVMMPNVLKAQTFPSRTIRIVVPFPAGATTDMLARLFAQRMTETMGQSVVVENVGGAGGSLGADQIAKASPDGHSLLFGNITFTTTTASLMLASIHGRTRRQNAVRSAAGIRPSASARVASSRLPKNR